VRVCTREGIVAAARAGVEGGANRVPIVTRSMLHITEPAPSGRNPRPSFAKTRRTSWSFLIALQRIFATSARCLSFLIMKISGSLWREGEGSTDG